MRYDMAIRHIFFPRFNQVNESYVDSYSRDQKYDERVICNINSF